jgi:hypothetical protein
MTQRPPNNDPALAMATLWQGDRARFDEALRLCSQRERVFFRATTGEKAEAERLLRAAEKVRDDMADKLESFTQAIFKTNAQSLEGASAKLAVAIHHCAPSDDSDEEPWPFLRNVHADLERLRV